MLLNLILKKIGPSDNIAQYSRKALFEQHPFPKVLTFQDCKSLTWEESFKAIFKQDPTEKDKKPTNKDAAIRYALTAMYQLLQHPESCIPYFQFLSNALEYHWKKERNNEAFPKFESNQVEFWNQRGMLWPIPNQNYQGIKKFSLIERLILDKFKQYGMGDKQFKWTGFTPKKESKTLLLENAFFTENRRTINGLFHGNTHNLQRVILLFAMEEGKIPSYYKQEDGQTKKLEFKEVFSALMRNDIFPTGKPNAPLWTYMLDFYNYESVNFSHPYRLHSILLTNPAFTGPLQDYMRYNFCTKFIQMSDLHNHVYGTNYNNKEMCNELLVKIQFHSFGGLPEFAIQMDEKRKN